LKNLKMAGFSEVFPAFTPIDQPLVGDNVRLGMIPCRVAAPPLPPFLSLLESFPKQTFLVGNWCRPFEVPAPRAANSPQELQMDKRHQKLSVASAHSFPKFVNGGC
jgi:hypothetical protein